MNYRLGIDLGTSSLGWCCLKMENEEIVGLLDMGVRIFSDGRNDQTKEPLCVARRGLRSARRRLKRFKLRQKQLINDLQQMGLFPTDKEQLKALEKENPYKLRADALHQQLSLYQIGRVIFHLNQRRGFLSNRLEEKQAKTKTQMEEKQTGVSKTQTKTQKAMDELSRQMSENNCLTLGEYMYKVGPCRFKNASDGSGKLVIPIYPNRSMYKAEFDLIWETQREYYPNILTEERKIRLRDYDIFYQRPLKKQETGFCSLEPTERRAPKAYPIAQEFRILSDIANLKITFPAERSLTKEEFEELFHFLNMPQKESYDNDYVISFEKIISFLKLPKDTIFNLMENNRQGLLCNRTSALLGTSETFGSVWEALSIEVKERIIDVLQDYGSEKEEIKDTLLELVPELSEDALNNILQQSLLLPDGYMNLSALAMHKIAEEMRLCGITYAEAVSNVYGKNPNEITSFQLCDRLPRYQELFSEQLIGSDKEKYNKWWDYDNYMGRITNVSVHIALNQLRQVVNELIRKYGKPEGITIELGRELTKGKKALERDDKRQKENAAVMAEARSEIKKAGLPITPFNLEKYKVWRNINPKDVTKRIDLYTGKTIALHELFNSEYEIEHILPYSWSYDDSYNNKIITRYNVNRKKLNQLPYHFFTDNAQLASVSADQEELAEMSLEKVLARAKDIDRARGNLKKTFNFNTIAWRFSKNAREIFNRNNKNMARDLTDMQYMSKLAKKYLTCICEESKIVSAKGQITDLFRKVWDVSDTLPRDYKLWEVQKWQKDALYEREAEIIQQNSPELDAKAVQKEAQKRIEALSVDEIHHYTSVKKDRSIHYHHALDAFVLANITPKIIHFVSGTAFADQAERVYENEKRENREITLSEVRTSLLKQSGKFYSKPYPDFDKKTFADRLGNLTVSYKEPIDKLKNIIKKSEALGKNIASFSFASISKDTAYGFRRILKVEKDDIRIEFSVKKDKKIKLDAKSLSCMVPVFRTKEQKAEFHKKYAEWLQASVRKKGNGKEEYQKIERLL